MKALPAGMQAHLDTGATTLAWCWRIVRRDGAVFGFTDHDNPLSFVGTDFEPQAGLVPAEIRSGSDLAVDAQDAEGVLQSGRITEADIATGLWDDAEVEVWRVNWETPAQRVLMRRGSIGQIRRGRVAFVAEVRSLAHTLAQTVGRTFQATCDAALGDTRCGIALASPAYSTAATAGAVLRDRAFVALGLGAFAAGFFAGGLVEWTSGPNAGRRAEIARHERAAGTDTLTLLEPPAAAIASGDGFTARAGCDKRFETCRDRFANTARFRGFPHVPGQDTILRYGRKDSGSNGSVL